MSTVTRTPGETEQHTSATEEEDERPISEAVVAELAAVEGVEPSALTERLYDSIDPDALNDLYRAANERGEHMRLAFTLGDQEVVVESGRRVSVRDADDAPSR